jgi:hypothetical protein
MLLIIPNFDAEIKAGKDLKEVINPDKAPKKTEAVPKKTAKKK